MHALSPPLRIGLGANGRREPGDPRSEHRKSARHRRRGHRKGGWHRRVLAYRSVDLVRSVAPEGGAVQCVLLVHIRKVVGRVTFEVCPRCSRGLITDLVVESRFQRSGLGWRALSHVRTCYPGFAWGTTLERRSTRGMLRRMRVLRAEKDPRCAHLSEHSADED